jgi:prepilin-type N-terminal cleavage/methylation domain-containing protein
MIRRRLEHRGFSLLELLATIVIALIIALAVIPKLQQRLKQSSVDAYTSRLEAGIKQLKSRIVNIQSGMEVVFPIGAGSEAEIKPNELETLQTYYGDNSIHQKPGFYLDTDPGTGMVNASGDARTTKTTSLRLVGMKNTLSPSQADDIRLIIYGDPDRISMNSIAGVVMLQNRALPLIIRIRSVSLKSKGIGFERCLTLAPMTGTVTRGTWIGNGSGGNCLTSK